MSIKFNPAINPFTNQNKAVEVNPVKTSEQKPNIFAMRNPEYSVMQTTRGMNFKAARAIQESVTPQNVQSFNPQVTVFDKVAAQLYNPKYAGITNNDNPVNVSYAGKHGITGKNLMLIG
jgi:hypothetical protein